MTDAEIWWIIYIILMGLPFLTYSIMLLASWYSYSYPYFAKAPGSSTNEMNQPLTSASSESSESSDVLTSSSSSSSSKSRMQRFKQKVFGKSKTHYSPPTRRYHLMQIIFTGAATLGVIILRPSIATDLFKGGIETSAYDPLAFAVHGITLTVFLYSIVTFTLPLWKQTPKKEKLKEQYVSNLSTLNWIKSFGEYFLAGSIFVILTLVLLAAIVGNVTGSPRLTSDDFLIQSYPTFVGYLIFVLVLLLFFMYFMRIVYKYYTFAKTPKNDNMKKKKKKNKSDDDDDDNDGNGNGDGDDETASKSLMRSKSKRGSLNKDKDKEREEEGGTEMETKKNEMLLKEAPTERSNAIAMKKAQQAVYRAFKNQFWLPTLAFMIIGVYTLVYFFYLLYEISIFSLFHISKTYSISNPPPHYVHADWVDYICNPFQIIFIYFMLWCFYRLYNKEWSVFRGWKKDSKKTYDLEVLKKEISKECGNGEEFWNYLSCEISDALPDSMPKKSVSV